MEEDNFAQWETLEQCRSNYCRKVEKYISCDHFGESDGMDGGCHWCLEMTPYQWEMCYDYGHKNNLIQRGCSEKEAIETIQNRKQRMQ